MTTPAYLNAALPVEQRVADLMGRMDIDEKLAQLGAVGLPDLITGERLDEEAALAVIPHGIGQVTRIGATTSLMPSDSARLYNRVQRLVLERTRLGIPIMVHEEALGGYCARGATVFPQALALASSWDPRLVEGVADTVRRQLLAVGARQSLAPVLDVARDPRWGRVEETYGEDPVLAGALGTAYVRGMQTDDLTEGVLATGKHFVAHGLSEGGRNRAPVQIGPRELGEVYAEPFAAAIRDAGLGSVMSSYSCVDGLPGSGSAEILTRLLREELGFEGLVVADYFAVSLLMTYHQVASDRSGAAVKAISAGLDLELPALDCFGEPLKAAVTNKKVSMGAVDTAVRRVLTTKMCLGLFDSPYADLNRVQAVFTDRATTRLARRAATSGIVLLVNKGILPIAPQVSRLAVIGPAADDRRLLQGDYHYPAHQEMFLDSKGTRGLKVPPLADAHKKVGTVSEVAPASRSAAQMAAAPTPSIFLSPQERSSRGHTIPIMSRLWQDSGLGSRTMLKSFMRRVASYRGATVAVSRRRWLQRRKPMWLWSSWAAAPGWTRASTVGEARDATDLRLTGLQEQLLTAVAATGTPTVLAVMSGRVHVLSDVVDHVQALLVAWPLGEQGGGALADVLLGRCEPTGRLPVTLPRATGQIPLHSGHRSRGARSEFYGDYTDCPHTPLFSFGHGLG